MGVDDLLFIVITVVLSTYSSCLSSIPGKRGVPGA